ncbi:MAG: endonuclease, partial [Cyanobacteria bacterium P01_G01_bin.49]
MERAEFLKKAGGVFTSEQDYKDWNSKDKYENFWSFFLDNNNGWVTSVYADIPIAELYRNGHSIEHIVPQSVLKTRLATAGKPQAVINGATTNPLNFMAAYSDLNSRRSTREFDTEGDSIIPNTWRVPLNPIAVTQTGLDFEGEWVVPSRTQGDVARCVLYMMLVYELDGLYEEDIDNMRRWALVDPPRDWEIAFNEWVFNQSEIRNPLITKDLEELKRMLESSSLFETTLADVPNLPAQPQSISDLPQGLEDGYGVLVGQIETFYRDLDDTPHLLFRVKDNEKSWRGSINVQSRFDVTVEPTPGVPANNLLVYVNEDWQHPITQRI